MPSARWLVQGASVILLYFRALLMVSARRFLKSRLVSGLRSREIRLMLASRVPLWLLHWFRSPVHSFCLPRILPLGMLRSPWCLCSRCPLLLPHHSLAPRPFPLPLVFLLSFRLCLLLPWLVPSRPLLVRPLPFRIPLVLKCWLSLLLVAVFSLSRSLSPLLPPSVLRLLQKLLLPLILPLIFLVRCLSPLPLVPFRL